MYQFPFTLEKHIVNCLTLLLANLRALLSFWILSNSCMRLSYGANPVISLTKSRTNLACLVNAWKQMKYLIIFEGLCNINCTPVYCNICHYNCIWNNSIQFLQHIIQHINNWFLKIKVICMQFHWWNRI